MSHRLACRLAAGAIIGVAILSGCAHQGASSSSTTQAIAAKQPFPSATPAAVVAVTEKIFPAIVRIDVASEVFKEGKRDVVRGIGSGVIIDADGHILTNFHVAGRAVELYVTLANKERLPAKLIGDDHWTDLAVIQLDMDAVRKKNTNFTYATLGSSSKLVPGENVMAIGTPFGLARTLTLGVVSNNERTFYPEEREIRGYETGEFNNWIQMDTPINPGNSGGPLVDLTGKVVGINTLGITGAQGLNFAVPIDTAKPVIAQILKSATNDQKGRVDRSDLGLDLKPLQDLETFYSLELNKGALINNVDRNSPAEKAGVKPQDVLLEINDKPMNVRFPEEVAPAHNFIANLPIGAPARLKVKRGNQTLDLVATTEKLQGRIGEEKSVKVWGLSIQEVTRAYANDSQLDDNKGVVIKSLTPGYPAADAELHYGDVIRSINRQPVDDLDAFLKVYNDSVKNKDEKVLLEIQRGRGKQPAVLKVTY